MGALQPVAEQIAASNHAERQHGGGNQDKVPFPLGFLRHDKTPTSARTEPADGQGLSHGVDEPCIYNDELSSDAGNDLRAVLGEPGSEAVAADARIFDRGEGEEGVAVAEPGALGVLDRLGRDAGRVILPLVREPRLIGLVELQFLGAQLPGREARGADRI